ncbi:MAG: ABC transporter permease, partial [Anaerolineae bacterium]|nr:ABC transporter permease [Anaerolineae bacterium]
MSTLQEAIHTHYTDNPIRWREILTLRRQRGKWFWRFMVGFSALIMLIPVLWGDALKFRDAFSFTIAALVIANVVAYVLVVLRGVLTATDAIQRERRDNTWDLLMLTGVSRWQLILGKWFGVMRVTAVDYLWLFFLRLGTIFWAVGQMNFNQISYTSENYYSWRLADVSFANDAWGSALLLLVIFTVLEWGFNTALGIGFGFFRWKSRT